MALSKSDVQNARTELENALRTVAKATGIDFTVGTIRFDSNSMRCKIEGTLRGASTTAAPVNAKDEALDGNSWRLGNNFDKTKSYKSPILGTVKIVGFARQAKKYPFIVLATNGKRYKITTLSAKTIVDAGAV